MDNVQNKKYLTLVITHQCNLRCTYCYEKHKDNLTMTVEKAIEILDKELTIDDGTEEVEIDFMGGEPLLEFDLIKQVVEYIKSKQYTKKYIFFLSTNGVLLDEKRKNWFAENSNWVKMGLSLDGTKAMHDVNRSNSFDKIDLDFFINTYPEQEIKMTISKETLPSLAEGVIFCHNKGFLVACNLAYGIDWSEKENSELLSRELMKLIEYYLENPDIIPCAMLNVDKIINVSQAENENIRICGAGWRTKAYDYDGTCYPCQHFLPISVGEQKARQSLSIHFPQGTSWGSDIDKGCAECILRNICMTCYGANYAATGDIHKHDENMCRLFKIQYKAVSYFAARLFELNRYTCEPLQVASIMKSALMIDEKIKI